MPTTPRPRIRGDGDVPAGSKPNKPLVGEFASPVFRPVRPGCRQSGTLVIRCARWRAWLCAPARIAGRVTTAAGCGARIYAFSQKKGSAVYAIVRCGGRQQKVSVGDVLEVDKVAGEVGSSVALPALLVVNDGDVTTDAAALGKFQVTAEILGETKGPKIRILKYKNKTGYKKRQGHRQRYTQVKVTGINPGQ
ncbi:hypothetical protein Pth03_31120 [Planotetraspora thailandica]|uniref:Large ribosomal subunit protein bL21 n=1 Tax=Planotetraspora thailandica TaxID=487172 RepID=A0A8J3XYN6_9ACTN|nr:hypothetical protein Pth03_31120 [Planotetraspora thailandica]